jgi:hypothetical protein
MEETDIMPLKGKITIPFELPRNELLSILWSADAYSPPYWYLYDKPDGKSWVDAVLDGENVKFVPEEDLDTKMWWKAIGPDMGEDGKAKLKPNARVVNINLVMLQRGFQKWLDWYTEKFKEIPDAGNCDMDCGDALIQFSVFGELTYG